MPIRILPTNRGGRSNFGGWLDTWTSNVLNNTQGITGIDSDDTNFYISALNGGATQNCFRFSPRSNLSSYTTPVYPIADDINWVICMGDQDTVVTGTSSAVNARVYLYSVSGNSFTNTNFPEFNLHDAIQCACKDPGSTDIFYIGTGSAAGSGQASVWRYVISTNTWTELFAFAGVGGHCVRSITFSQGEMFVGTGHYVTNGNARLWRSTNPGYTAFTQIAGDTVNGSWAAGTLRGAVCFFSPQSGILYAGLNGSVAGDAEAWRSTTRGQSWTKIGGDGLNSGWAAGTKTAAIRIAPLGNKVAYGLGGTAAGDSEIWQWDEDTSLWTKIGGDGLNGSWTTQLSVFCLYIDPESNRLFAGGGNNTVNTSFYYRVSPVSPLTTGTPGYNYQPYPIYAVFQ